MFGEKIRKKILHTINKKEELCVNDKIEQKKTLLFLLYNIFAAILIMTMFFLKLGPVPTGIVIFISLFSMVRIYIKLVPELKKANKDPSESEQTFFGPIPIPTECNKEYLVVWYNIFISIIMIIIMMCQEIKPEKNIMINYILVAFTVIMTLFVMLLFGCQIVYDYFEESDDKSN